jgi:hypothetical protein
MTITADTDPGVDCGIDTERLALEALELLTVVDVESADRADLEVVLTARRTVAAFLDTVDIRVVRRSRQLAEEGRCEPPTELLRQRGRRSERDASGATKREQACGEMPGFEQALIDGSVSAGHLDAVADATAALDDTVRAAFAEHEPALVEAAKRTSVETFGRHCRDLARQVSADDGGDELAMQRARNRVRRWVDKVTGMHHVHAELDPETASKVWTAINQRLRTLRHEQRGSGCPADAAEVEPVTYSRLEAQAFVDLVTGSAALDPRSPEVIVVIDLDTLVDGLHRRSLCETVDGVALPPSAVRRLCCSANIIPVVLDGDGEALDAGRAKRLATPGQRRAIHAMYATCGWPGCQVPVDRCEIHHVDEWARDHGDTDLARLIPLCIGHHHLVHDNGWTIDLGAGRTVTVHRPDGAHHFTGNTTNRHPARSNRSER